MDLQGDQSVRGRGWAPLLVWALLGWLAWAAGPAAGAAAPGILTLRDGYFWDSSRGEHFLPRGVAYQTFNPPVGATQSPEQIAFDFEQFVALRANSVRCEFVWSQIEVEDDVYDWTKADQLIAEAERLGLRLFVIIGFQYPPKWFSPDWMGVNDRVLITPDVRTNWQSDVLNYEHPAARLAYSNHVARVTARYKDSAAIGAWILGNEYAYFDLWEDINKYKNRRMLGHDAWSRAAFQAFLRERYAGRIEGLNANWRTALASFDEVQVPGAYPEDRDSPAHLDAYQWRKESIGDFVALGARAALANDPNHLTTYSMVGGIYNGLDANFTAEDGRAIVERCRRAGAPLDFWSINNYAWAALGSEMRCGDFGIAKYQALTGLPVMISETGHSSTETVFDPGLSSRRQARALPSQLWEGFMSGAIGLHIFTWNDRELFTEAYFLRERGFGFATPQRRPKPEVFERVRAYFLQMENVQAERLFGGSWDPKPDVQFFWSDDSDLGWSIANQENAMLWGVLKRIGLQPGIIGDAEFEQGAATNAPVLLLSRAFGLRPSHLERLRRDVLGAGIHLHANADLPGQFNAWHAPNPGWAAFTAAVFGLGVAGAYPAVDLWATVEGGVRMEFSPSTAAPGIRTDPIRTWKIWHGLTPVAGTTRVWQRGVNGSQPILPALQVVNHPRAKAAVNTFALGDLDVAAENTPPAAEWGFRGSWLRDIYSNVFGLRPAILVEGEGLEAVYRDYRWVRGGGVLISLLNGSTNPVVARLPVGQPLLAGRRLERVSTGGMVAAGGNGRYEVPLDEDECVVLYAYPPSGGGDGSLVNPSPDKVWFSEAPGVLVPGGPEYRVRVRVAPVGAGSVRVTLEQTAPVRRVLAEARPLGGGNPGAPGEAEFLLAAPPAGGDAGYVPSEEGAEYQVRAWVEAGGVRRAGVEVPVWIQPGVRLASVAGNRVAVTWSGLPVMAADRADADGWLDPLGRLEWWDSRQWGTERAVIRVQALDGDRVVAEAQELTGFASGRREWTLALPPGVGAGSLTWVAEAWRPSDYRSPDFFESFEGRNTGAWAKPLAEDPTTPSPIDPWTRFRYGNPAPLWWDEGVHPQGSHGGQSAFLVHTNAPGATGAGFGIKRALPEPLRLPANRAEWGRYRFGFDFKEDFGYPCLLELQIANADPVPPLQPSVMSYTREYRPGPGGWDRIEASLAEFVHPDWSPPFDPDAVVFLVCNVILQKDQVMYLDSIDRVHFDGPDEVIGLGTRLGRMVRGRSSLPPDGDGDGLPDALERGTGVFAGDGDPGTRPDRADSDGDGVNDGDEVRAGTDPNQAGDLPALRLAAGNGGGWELRWATRPGRQYRVLAAGELDGRPFEPVGDGGYRYAAEPGEDRFPISPGAAGFYRLEVRRP